MVTRARSERRSPRTAITGDRTTGRATRGRLSAATSPGPFPLRNATSATTIETRHSPAIRNAGTGRAFCRSEGIRLSARAPAPAAVMATPKRLQPAREIMVVRRGKLDPGAHREANKRATAGMSGRMYWGSLERESEKKTRGTNSQRKRYTRLGSIPPSKRRRPKANGHQGKNPAPAMTRKYHHGWVRWSSSLLTRCQVSVMATYLR